MWLRPQPTWVLHDPVFRADTIDPERAGGPWSGHRWFAYDLIRWGGPQTIVELGTHYGVSFFSFCQAVADGHLDTRLHAVDTWKGDPHAGAYGEDVYELVLRVLGEAYAGVDVTLHRCLFDEALERFEDRSIDLLHIDGFHTYEAVEHDFTSWLPKLAPNAVVLFHDVAVSSGFGSAEFWNHVRDRYPSLRFGHSSGLGVLLPTGTEGLEYLLSDEFSRWSAYYGHRGWHAIRALEVRHIERMVDERNELIGHQDKALAERAEVIARQDEALAERAEVIAHQDKALAERDQLIETRDLELRRARAELAERDAEIERQRARATELEHGLEDAHRQARLIRRPTILRIVAALPRRRSEVRPFLGKIRRRLAPRRSAADAHSAVGDASVGPADIDDALRIVFDSAFYLAHSPHVALAEIDPLEHFLRFGWREGRDPSPLFDTSYYLITHPDVASAGDNPLEHYLRWGADHGHNPAPWFDTQAYLAANPDVAEAGLNPLVHYVLHGAAEGRFVSAAHRERVLSGGHSAAVGVSGPRAVRRCLYLSDATAPLAVPLDTLASSDVSLVTFDLWDTLLVRSRPADSAKLATARRVSLLHHRGLDPRRSSSWDLFRSRVEVEAELAREHPAEEYELHEVLDRQLARDVPGLGDAERRALTEELVEAEISDEVAATRAVPDTWRLLHDLRNRPNPPTLAVVSDFYLRSEALARVLRAHEATAKLPIFVSCEVGESKRVEGRLFRRVRSELGDVSPERHLHIGDNAYTDGQAKVASGGPAAVVQLDPAPFPAAGALTPERVGECMVVLDSELGQLARVHGELTGRSDRSRRAASAGARSALLPAALVIGAIEDALRLGLDRIHYVSREGAFLARVHDAIATTVAHPAPPPRAVHLELSRRSTFGPSLRSLDHSELGRMWSMYGSQSLRALLVSIGAEPEAFAGQAREEGLDLDETIEGVADDGRVRAFLARADVHEPLVAELAERRALLVEYLAGVTDLGGRRLMVVDVGWRGTIQDNLAAVLPDHELIGRYLGLFPFLNAQPGNATKRAVGFDANQGDEYAFAEPPAAIERPWTPAGPSPIGYRRSATGIVVVHEAGDAPHTDQVDAFQDAAVEGARLVASTLASYGFTVEMIAEQVKAAVRRYYHDPPAGVSDIWFDNGHDDTFGALGVTPFGKERPSAAWLADTASDELLGAARESRWEGGYRSWLPVEALTALGEMRREVGR